MARSERFELPTLGIEIRCSIQLSYECVARRLSDLVREGQPPLRNTDAAGGPGLGVDALDNDTVVKRAKFHARSPKGLQR